MNFKARALMAAKAISVWWGIYIILGCCICFSVNILFGLFFTSKNTGNYDLKILIPLLIGGALILGVFSYIISIFARRAPERKVRRKLDKIIEEKGICKDYTDMLFANARAEMKNRIYIEIAFTYSVMGEYKQSENVLDKLDLVSILDIAQSTGNFFSAAYYYACKLIISLQNEEYDLVEQSYKDGKYYFDALENDSFITVAGALYKLFKGKIYEACSDVKKIRTKSYYSQPDHLKNGIVVLIKAYILNASGDREEAEAAVMESLNFKLTPHYEKIAIDLAKKIRGYSVGNSVQIQKVTAE